MIDRSRLVARSAVLGAVATLLLAGCASSSSSSSPDGEDALTGRASLALAVVPPDVTCIQISAVGSRTVKQSFAVKPLASSVLSMNALPVGSVTFTANAYALNSTGAASCTGLATTSVPTWLSNTVTATVSSTSSVALTLSMTQNGQSTVTVNFDGGGSTAPVDAGPSDATVPPPPTDAGPEEGGSGNGGSDAGPTEAGAAPTVTIATPSATSYVSTQTLPIQVSTIGALPSSVDLLLDGATIATIGSPFEYTLATSSLAAGTHSLVAAGHFGSATVDSAPRTIVVDRTSPTIVSRTPANGASNVHVADPIVVQFSEPVLASSVTGSAVTLSYAGAAIGYSTSLSIDGKSLTVVPASPTDGGGSFTLSLTSVITDLAGNALTSGPLSWSWTSPQWLTYAAPTLPTYTSTTAFSADNGLFLSADWNMGSPTTFEFDATASTTAGETLPSVLFENLGSTWSAVAPPTFPVAPAGYQASFFGYTMDATGLGAYWYDSPTSTNTTAAARFIEQVASYSGTAWSPFTYPSEEDPTYGYFVTDAAGNAYHSYCPTGGTQCTFYERVNGAWTVVSTLPVPANTRTSIVYTTPGSYLAFNYPWSTTGTVSGNLTLSSFNGASWTTLINAPNPVNATALTYYETFVDSSNNLYVGFAPCSTSTGAACSAYLMTPNGNAWQLVGGGPLPTQVYDWDASSVSGAFAFDRFGRLSAFLDGYMGAAGTIQYVVVDYRNGAWQTPIDVPVPTAPTDASDVGFGAYLGGADFAGNSAWIETHATADASGLNATATAAIHLLNR
jgi:hypothetical protein